MKTIVAISIIISALLFSCKSGDSLTKQEQIDQITEKIESQNYKFVPRTAMPMSGRTINLSYSYSLDVSKDTISSYLPYFGRAYSAPLPMDEGGVKFVATNFEYTISEKKKGEWDVKINVKENNRLYDLSLIIGDSGNATLTVNEQNRQSISFFGKIE
ncbi:MAG: DUF4251 domain-containing protein [Dysgonomonas sp.]|nr:DUF4251 domain-containing protein [Dysgonomonas sp.]